MDIMLELRLEKCGDRKVDRNVITGEVRVLCNSRDYCKAAGGTIFYKGEFRRTCSYECK